MIGLVWMMTIPLKRLLSKAQRPTATESGALVTQTIISDFSHQSMQPFIDLFQNSDLQVFTPNILLCTSSSDTTVHNYTYTLLHLARRLFLSATSSWSLYLNHAHPFPLQFQQNFISTEKETHAISSVQKYNLNRTN